MRTLVMAVVGFFLAASEPAHALDFYLYIPTIPGEASTPGYPGDIRLLSFSFDEGGHQLTVGKLIDSASPSLLSADVKGTEIPIIDLLLYNVSGLEAQPDNIISLSNSIVSRYVPDNTATRPSESVTFNFTSTVAAIPEPTTTSMMVGGLMVAGIWMSCRKWRRHPRLA